MKKALNIIRATLIALAVLLIATPVSLYVILSTSWAQDSLRRVASNELSALLATELSIGRIEIHPFNSISIHDVSALDDNGEPAFAIEEISAAFELFHLLRTGQLVIDYALVYRPTLSLSKETKDSPLNFSNILAALKSDKPKKHQSRYDLQVNTVIVRNGSLSYDVKDAPARDSIFDPSHILISEIFLNAYIPRISNSEYRVEIDRFAFKESSGFELKDLTAAAAVKADGSVLERLKIQLPNSTLDFKTTSLANKTIETLISTFVEEGIGIGIISGSSIYPPDLKAFAPVLSKIDYNVGVSCNCKVSSHDISVDNLILSTDDNSFQANIKAAANDIDKGTDAELTSASIRLSASTDGLRSVLHMLRHNNFADNILKKLRSNDNLSANINANGPLNSLRIGANVAIADNALHLNGHVSSRDSFRTVSYQADGAIDFANLAMLLPPDAPSAFHAGFSTKGRMAHGRPDMDLSVDSASVIYKGIRYGGISLHGSLTHDDLEASLAVRNRLMNIEVDCNGHFEGKTKTFDAAVRVDNADLAIFGVSERYRGYSLNTMIDTQLEFTDIDDIDGSLSVTDLCLCDTVAGTPDLKLSALTIAARPRGDSPGIDVSSDFINGYVNGPYRVSTLYPTLRSMVCSVFPALEDPDGHEFDLSEVAGDNNFTFSFRIDNCENACRFFSLPVVVVHPVGIKGHVSDLHQAASVNVDAPYLQQGDNIIESTRLSASIDAADDSLTVYATTKMPTKKGPMTISADLSGASDRVDSRIDWMIERAIPINGSFDFSTLALRDDKGKLGAEIRFNPGTITFGSDIWAIQPSVIGIADKRFTLDDFSLQSDDKSIAIDGTVSADDYDYLYVTLKNITLLDIFETLEIDKALIGGEATGVFIGHGLLSQQPEISCRRLHVKDISYNRCVLGNADVEALWNNEKKAFSLKADIIGATGLPSHVYGEIYPATEELDITFDVNRVPVGFLKPFMAAFAADLRGYASGRARLFGDFKNIDLEGDVFADNLGIKIDFTNTWYSATDSIHLRPGLIEIPDIVISDINGNTAHLSGFVSHKYFKDPSFRFDITDAQNFLSYDVDAIKSSNWYGTIYGNGSASVSGEPGVVNIGVNMSTAPNSDFTFVLSDRLDAADYSFITFTDTRGQARRDSLLAIDTVPEAIRRIRERRNTEDSDQPSAFNMDFQIDLNPNVRITLLMDPVSGDAIKATGSGVMNLSYGSVNNDLKMRGIYTLDRGSYNFTLQDIIIKDFTISNGSTIEFNGDPYSATLDIRAIYSVNANLSDLDESFLQDKDLNRTNVPVHAMLLVTGDMRQPDIDFDLEFPTLTQDIYRKVRSIISTKDMMNRQIIYLLALNRFYTPDYMASTTKGNELVSVASSTISSQLGSMLGKLSDDWSIAPNLRSDRGDFSDVEVDVALSSRLLNNRLLFNGNFGYRDKTLNTNQFVGDFDIEYLLNPKGSWRLKAYNRYNDQNYYVRTAQTTQGIGLVFKRDFNDFFHFLRRKKK